MGLALASNAALAVDGYKNLKFGMSQEDVNNTNICTLSPQNLDVQGVEALGCTDLQFGGKSRMAVMAFMDNKLERVMVIQDAGSIEGLLAGLSEKYGAPSSVPSAEELQRVNATGGSIEVKFDGDTVIVRGTIAHDKSETVLLMYSTPDYDEKLAQQQKGELQSDL